MQKIIVINEKLNARKYMFPNAAFPAHFDFKNVKEARDYVRIARKNAKNVEKRLGSGAYLDDEGIIQCMIADFIEDLLIQ